MNEICELINNINDKVIKIKQKYGNKYDNILNNFVINAYSNNDNINYVDYNEFTKKISLLTFGYCELFSGNFMCGKIITDTFQKKILQTETKNELIIYQSQYDNSDNLKFLLHIDSLINFDIYTNNVMIFKVSKKHYMNIYEVINDINDNYIFYDGYSVMLHPLYYINNFILSENNDNNVKDIIKFGDNIILAKTIIYNKFELFKRMLMQNNINISICDELFNICLFLDKYDFIDYMILNQMKPSINTIFNAIDNYKIKYIEILNKNKINVDVLTHDGFNSAEYVLNICKKTENSSQNYDKNIYDILVLLNNCKYTRNPKWWDYINNINIFNFSLQNEFEKDVKNMIDNNNIKTIIQLNNCILEMMTKHNMFHEIMIFIKKNIKFINLYKFLEYILLHKIQ
jgi:hypothetical protein